LQEIKLIGRQFLQMQILAELVQRQKNMGVQDTSRTTIKRELFAEGFWDEVRRLAGRRLRDTLDLICILNR
jgi:hypothetical protein